MVLDLFVVLEDFLDDEEDGVLIFDEVFELVDLGEVGEELAVERHALVGEFVVRPVLFDDLVHH